jgi:hypothetical protein
MPGQVEVVAGVARYNDLCLVANQVRDGNRFRLQRNIRHPACMDPRVISRTANSRATDDITDIRFRADAF